MQLSRTTLTLNDPYGDRLVVWMLDGMPAGSEQLYLRGPDGTPHALHPTYPFAADTCYWFGQEYRLSPHTPAGIYTAVLAGEDGPLVTVAERTPPPRRKRSYTVLGPFSLSADEVRSSFRHGKPVWLEAGLYDQDAEIDTRDCVDPLMVGVGARLRRLPDPPGVGYGHRMFHGCGGLTLLGLELEPAYLVGHANPETANWRLIDCRLIGRTGRETLGWGQRNVHVERCVFEGVFAQAPGVYLRNKWKGPGGGLHFNGPIEGGLCLIDNEVDGCPRGLVVNTNGGPVTDCFVAGLKVHGLTDNNNGDEALLFEGAHPYSRNLHCHTRVWDSPGSFAVSAWDAGGEDCRFVDTVQTGGLGLWLGNAANKPLERYVFDLWELRNSFGIGLGWRDAAGVVHGEGIRDCVFRRGAVVGLQGSAMMNQGGYYPWLLDRRAALASGIANGWDISRVEHVRFDLPPGATPWDGYTPDPETWPAGIDRGTVEVGEVLT